MRFAFVKRMVYTMTERDDVNPEWIHTLIRQAAETPAPSDEILWLQGKFNALGRKYGMERRQDVDRLVAQKMTGSGPVEDSRTLKIRYWRTGRHKPQSRRQCLELGRALELDPDETRYLLQGYYDGADRIFDGEEPENPVYQFRIRVIRELERQYLWNAHPDRLEWLNIPWKNPEAYLRHYYFQDAASYASGSHTDSSDHFSSTNYVSEFQKSRRLMGEIPRRTVLRHLLIMSAPFLSVRVINERLDLLGYLPLSEGHESRSGERVDLLILGFLKHYETECGGASPEQCMAWLRHTYQMMDEELVSSGHPELRFLHFKALSSY